MSDEAVDCVCCSILVLRGKEIEYTPGVRETVKEVHDWIGFAGVAVRAQKAMRVESAGRREEGESASVRERRQSEVEREKEGFGLASRTMIRAEFHTLYYRD